MKKNKEKNDVQPQQQQQQQQSSFVTVPDFSDDHQHRSRHTYPTKKTPIDESCLLLFSKNKQSRLEVLSFLNRFKRTGHDEFRQECSDSNGRGRSGIVFPFKVINYPIFLEFYQTHTELAFHQKTPRDASFKQKIKNRYSRHSEKIHISGKCIGMSLTDQENNRKICSLDQPIVTAPDFLSKIEQLNATYLKAGADTPEGKFAHKLIKIWKSTEARFGIEIATGIQAIHPKEASHIFLLAYKTQLTTTTNRYGDTSLSSGYFPICLAHAYLLFHMPDDHPSTFIPPICDVYEEWLKRSDKDDNQSLFYETVLRNSGALYIQCSIDDDDNTLNLNNIKKKEKKFMKRFFSGNTMVNNNNNNNNNDSAAKQNLLDYAAEFPSAAGSNSVYSNQSYFAEAMHFFHHIVSPLNCCSNATTSRSLRDVDDTSMQSIHQKGIVDEFLEKRINKTADYHQVSTTDHAYYDEKDDNNTNNNNLSKEITENPFESDFDSEQ